MTKLIGAFRNFANAPKNSSSPVGNRKTNSLSLSLHPVVNMLATLSLLWPPSWSGNAPPFAEPKVLLQWLLCLNLSKLDLDQGHLICLKSSVTYFCPRLDLPNGLFPSHFPSKILYFVAPLCVSHVCLLSGISDHTK